MENSGCGGFSKQEVLPQQPGRTEFERDGKDVADTDIKGLQGRDRGIMQECTREWAVRESGAYRADGGEQRTAQPGLGGEIDGLPCWLDEVRRGWIDGSWEYGIPRNEAGVKDRINRLKCLGNAVVPQQFYPLFRAIMEIEKEAQPWRGKKQKNGLKTICQQK